MNRVVVIGNAGLDRRLQVPHLPGPGETLIGADGGWMPGGKGLNQAVVAARCGVPARFCAPLGQDEAQAAEIECHLMRETFEQLHLPRLPHATDFSLLMVLPDGENSIVSTSACSLALSVAQAAPVLQDLAAGDVVLLQGNLSIDVTRTLLVEARRRQAVTVFNPAPYWPGAETVMDACSLVIANRLEAQSLGGSLDRATAAIVTLGAEGCRFAGRVFPAETVAAIDTTGCGDVFCAVMAAALARGSAIEPAIGWAQKAAALTATRAGAFAALPRRDELAALFASRVVTGRSG